MGRLYFFISLKHKNIALFISKLDIDHLKEKNNSTHHAQNNTPEVRHHKTCANLTPVYQYNVMVYNPIFTSALRTKFLLYIHYFSAEHSTNFRINGSIVYTQLLNTVGYSFNLVICRPRYTQYRVFLENERHVNMGK